MLSVLVSRLVYKASNIVRKCLDTDKNVEVVTMETCRYSTALCSIPYFGVLTPVSAQTQY